MRAQVAEDRQSAAPGNLLSGEKLADAPAFEAVGGGMKASGIVDAASRRPVRWLIVKRSATGASTKTASPSLWRPQT